MASNPIPIALSGIQLAKQQFEVISHNIANKDTKDYTAKIGSQDPLVIGNTPQGVRYNGITSTTSDSTERALNTMISESSYANNIGNYYKRVTDLLGHVAQPNGLAPALNNVFGSFQTLIANPSSQAKREVVNKLDILTSFLQSTSYSLQNMRLEADQSIEKELKLLNVQTASLFDLYRRLPLTSAGSAERASIEDSIRFGLQKVSESFGIKYFYDNKGVLNVEAEDSSPIVGSLLYQFEYSAASSVESFINNTPLSPIIINAFSSHGKSSGYDKEMVSGGISTSLSYPALQSGSIPALLRFRDYEIPNLLNELDNLAMAIKTEFNMVYNEGSSFPQPVSFSGTKSFSLDSNIVASGTCTLAFLDLNGNPLEVNGNYLPSFNMDLSSISSPNGSTTINNLISEMKQYNEVMTGARAQVGVNQLTLSVAGSAASGFTFAPEILYKIGPTIPFQITSFSANNSKGEVLSTSITANTLVNVVPNPTTQTIPTNTFEIKDNDLTSFANYPITLNITALVNGTPTSFTYTLTQPDTKGAANITNKPSAQIYDIKLATNTVNPLTSGTMDFKFDISNFSGSVLDGSLMKPLDVSFTLNSITATTVGTLGISSTITGTALETIEGQVKTKLNSFSLNDSLLTNPASYPITIEVVAYVDSIPSQGFPNEITLTYTIPAPGSAADLTNTRYSVASVVNGGSLQPPLLTQGGLLNVNLQDENGSIISDPEQFGFLSFQTANTAYRLHISNSLNPSNPGILYGSSGNVVGPIKGGLNNFFGLNDLFITKGPSSTWYQRQNTALNLGVRPDILSTTDTFVTGKLAAFNNRNETSPLQRGLYSLSVADTTVLSQLINLNNKPVNFSQAGYLSPFNTTISSYTAQIISITSVQTKAVIDIASNKKAQLSGIKDVFLGESAVSLDNELAKMLAYADLFKSSGKIIQITRQIYDKLLDSF